MSYRRLDEIATGSVETGAECVRGAETLAGAATEPGSGSGRSNGPNDLLHGPTKRNDGKENGECEKPGVEWELNGSLDAQSQAQTQRIERTESCAQASRNVPDPVSSLDRQPAALRREVFDGGRGGVSEEQPLWYGSAPSEFVRDRIRASPPRFSGAWVSGSDSEKENPRRRWRDGKRPSGCVPEARRETPAASGARARPLLDLPLGTGVANDVMLTSSAGKRARAGAKLEEGARVTSLQSSPPSLGTMPGGLPPSHRVSAPKVKEVVGKRFEVTGGSLDFGLRSREQHASLGVVCKPKKKVCHRDVLLGFSAPR